MIFQIMYHTIVNMSSVNWVQVYTIYKSNWYMVLWSPQEFIDKISIVNSEQNLSPVAVMDNYIIIPDTPSAQSRFKSANAVIDPD